MKTKHLIHIFLFVVLAIFSSCSNKKEITKDYEKYVEDETKTPSDKTKNNDKIYFSDDFGTGIAIHSALNSKWTVFPTEEGKDIRKFNLYLFQNNNYAYISGYKSTSDFVTWMITPKITSSTDTTPLKFKTIAAYGNTSKFSVLYSTNFDGKNYNTATWIKLKTITDSSAPNKGYGKWIDYSLTIPVKSFYVAFKFEGNGTTMSSTRGIDDIIIGKSPTNKGDDDNNNGGGDNKGNGTYGSYYRTSSTNKPSWGTYGIPSQPTWGYVTSTATSKFYSSLNGLKGEPLRSELKKLVTGTVNVSYSRSRYTATDEDPRNTNNIILIYKGTSVKKSATSSWNREHVFACSNGGFRRGKSGGGSDNHHIRCSNPSENSKRGNKKLGSGYTPRQAVQGDVARMTFYVSLVYGVLPGRNINVPKALIWNKQDKVDDWEMKINNVINKNQGNRNPFIDRPELIDFIFGDKKNVTYNVK